MIRSGYAVLVACAIMLGTTAQGAPWLAPGDVGLRQDIQLLADAGILRGPVTTWPLSWPDIARDVLALRPNPQYPDSVLEALLRVQARARRSAARGGSGALLRLSGLTDAGLNRDFSDSPREEGELTVGTSWLSDHMALNVRATVVADADDDKTFRPDGSYLGVNVGNFMLSAGYVERWWGPGWDSSLILSTNARPIPGLSLERNYTDPFKSRLLSWLGPWRASITLGRAEGHDVAVADTRFLAARVNFRPRPWLEMGLSRTAQWCGGNRPCDLGTFADLLMGRDNRSESLSAAEEPGNQMAGYDLRLRSPWMQIPVAFYTQWIGEDEAGGLPSKFIGLFGAESWFNSPLGLLRVRAEFSDTTCSFPRERPEFGCAYRNSLYPQGYTFRGRSLGSWMDNDSRSGSIGVTLRRPNGQDFSVLWQQADLNRDGGSHLLTISPLIYKTVELRHSRGLASGRLNLEVNFDNISGSSNTSLKVRGFASWQQGF